MRKLLAKPRRTSFAFRLHSFTLASAIISAVAAPTPENEPHDVRVTEHHGVRMLSDEVAHIVQSRETVPASWCDSVPNTHHALDTKGFCLDGRSCWPPMYLLGVQKAATTSIVDALWQCGQVALGLTSNDVENPACHAGENIPCKEVLHSPIDLRTSTGRTLFTRMHDPSRCSSIAPIIDLRGKVFRAGHLMEHACQERRFLEATPLGIGDSPPLQVLLAAIPAPLLARARFTLILREPVARILSWFNHMRGEHHFYGTPCDTSSFDSFFKCVHEQGLDDFEMGKYVHWLDEFKRHARTTRTQLLVLPFDFVLSNATEAIRLITLHFGLPVMTALHALPEDNSHDGPDKVVRIRCSTRDHGVAAYSDWNQKLYAEMRRAHSFFTLADDSAPVYEPPFPPFTPPECTTHEETMGELPRPDFIERFRLLRRRDPTALEMTRANPDGVWMRADQELQALASARTRE